MVDTHMRYAVTNIQNLVCTRSQKAQSFDHVPSRAAKIPVWFSRKISCLCIWKRKLPASLLIRCCNWKTSFFTSFLESYFNSCREAVKWDERKMSGAPQGKKNPSILSCRIRCTMVCSCSNKPQMCNRWPQVKTWWGRVWWYLCTETTSTSSICSTLKHLSLWLISPSKLSAGHPLRPDKPSTGGLLEQHSQGLGT